MTLKDILESKPYEIVIINKERSVGDAIKIMREKNVSGIFVVDENNKLVSLFTERDIIHCVFNNVSLDKPVENVMDINITTFSPSMEISSAIAVTLRNKKRHLPIVEGDKIVGMITFRDLVSYLLPEICYMAEALY